MAIEAGEWTRSAPNSLPRSGPVPSRRDGGGEVVDQERDLSHSCGRPERVRLVLYL